MVISDDEPVDEGHEGNGSGADEHEAPFEAEQLVLDEDEERLPWLEGDDDFDDDEESGTGRVVGLLLFGLLLLGAVVGGVWWATHRNADETLVADGSTIKAPAGRYKEAPANPGGKTFAGTGDTTFAVSEGQTRPVHLGEQGGEAKPGVDLTPKPNVPVVQPSTSAHAPASPAPAAEVSGTGVQVGAFSTRATHDAQVMPSMGNDQLWLSASDEASATLRFMRVSCSCIRF